MAGNALGYIEAIGLVAAVEAADTAVKSANVRLLGYELAKGDGMTTVKIEGDVGAVKSAVNAAAAAAARVGTVVSTHVIANPAGGTARITRSRDTVGLGKDGQKDRQPVVAVPPPAENEPARLPLEPEKVANEIKNEPAQLPLEPGGGANEIKNEPAQLPLEPGGEASEIKEGKKPKGHSKNQSKKSGN